MGECLVLAVRGEKFTVRRQERGVPARQKLCLFSNSTGLVCLLLRSIMMIRSSLSPMAHGSVGLKSSAAAR